MSPSRGEKRLTREQKTGFVLLLVFGILAVGLGMLQMRNAIYAPFAARGDAGGGASVAAFFDENTRLQQIDTDQDGLNDYEELNFYGTSAYLPDTDSDGILDKTEIEEGTNPLCPEGTACAAAEASPSATTTVIQPLGGEAVTPLDVISEAFRAPQTIGAESVDIETLLQSPDLIRQLLLQSGNITEEQLTEIDDETLLELAREVLSGSGGNEEIETGN